MNIGDGSDLFDLKISIDKFHNQSVFTSKYGPCWLSYRFIRQVVQSEILVSDSFTPMSNSFQIRTSIPELVTYFREKKNATLRIHVCTNGQILGTAAVDLEQLLKSLVGISGFEGRRTSGIYTVYAASYTVNCDDNNFNVTPARLVVTVCIDNEPQHISTDCYVSSPLKISKSDVEEDENSALHTRQNWLDEKGDELKAREEHVCKKEKDVYESVAALEKKRCEWEQWRHCEELKWHEKLRAKEAAAMRAIEERVASIEKERLRSLEASRTEYEKLEKRLRSALLDVESKERQLKESEISQEHKRNIKKAELDLREKLMKEELKHTIDIERAKTNAAIEQAAASEKSLAAAGKKIKLLEDEIDEIKTKHRNTPEVTLMQQLAEVKGQLAESERRIETIKAEKADLVLEKEQFRASVNKLARALRHEREKATKRKEMEQVRLSYDSNDNAFVLGGRQDEVQRILSDLNDLTKLQSPSKNNIVLNTKASNDQSNNQLCEPESKPLSSLPPMPSPQPSRPNCTSPTHSITSSLHSGYSLDIDRIIKSPS